MSGEICKDTACERWIEPQTLQRRDDTVASEYGAKPWNPGVRIGAIASFGSQHVEVSQRTVQPVIELFVVGENLRFPSADTFERCGCVVHDHFIRFASPRCVTVYLARNYPLIVGILAGFQMDLATDEGLGHTRWFRVEYDPRPAEAMVQSFVRQQQTAVGDLRFQATAVMFTRCATQFKNIGKVGIELDRQEKVDSCASVIMNAKPLMTGFVP